MSACVVYLYTPMTMSAETLPNRIREHRKAAGLTLQELADDVGISKSLMGLLERGDRPLHVHRQRAIARRLGVEMAELLSYKDNPSALTADEKRLLGTYRTLDARGRYAVLSVAETEVKYQAQPAEEELRKRA